ncbi:MAG TPA: ATP-dependent DNA helicase, partial [Dehalococcoidia bacterium]|nr:ATP-dependent DNA helicase [Dehalococcoidia bacterium]
QAVLYAPVFPVRWRWDAGRALAVPRFSGARKVPPPIQRMRADDLLAAVFPAQVGCQENVTGPLEIPDHPLIRQTVLDCLHEAMDLNGLIEVLQRVEAGEIRLHAIDTLEPSPMAHEILSGKPYTYLDDAPLEERRTRAVTLRRALPENARELGALDQDAIDRVREEAWPQPRDAEEAHDALLGLVVVPAVELVDWQPWLEELIEAGRAARLTIEQQATGNRQQGEAEASSLRGAGAARAEGATLLRSAGSSYESLRTSGAGRLVLAAENLNLVRLLYPDGVVEPEMVVPEAALARVEDRDEARSRLIRGWTEAGGPVSAAGLGARLGLRAEDIDRGLRQVESLGFVLRGRFSPGVAEDEFCDRRLLARIHRYTLDRLRREIDPVSQQDFMRFLLRWQHLMPDTKLAGKQGVRQVIARLEGFEAPAGAWERELLASRLNDYRSSWLDELCLAGEIAWARLTPRKASAAATASASRSTPVSLTLRSDLHTLLAAVRYDGQQATSNRQQGRQEPGVAEAAPGPKAGAAAEIRELLQARGALFFDEIVNGTRRLRSDVERGLRELVAWGLVTADGFQGLRQLSGKAAHSGRRRSSEPNYAAGGFFTGSGPAGRWAVVPNVALEPDGYDELAESIARVLLQRYGVVFRDLWARESFSLPWRDVLRALRRLEARGTVRGGRFVSGPSGEQYALPEAVDALRRVRRTERKGERVWVSAIDPLNLAGVILPGGRVPAMSGRGILYVDGLPQAELAGELPAVKPPVPSKLSPRLAERAR